MHLTSLPEATAQQVRDLFRPKKHLIGKILSSSLSDQPSPLKKDRPPPINPEEIHPF